MKEIRSKWCHPDDRQIVRDFVDRLNEQHKTQQELTDTAIHIRNFSESSYFVSDLVVIKDRERFPVTYKSKGRLCQANKSQTVTFSDIRKAK